MSVKRTVSCALSFARISLVDTSVAARTASKEMDGAVKVRETRTDLNLSCSVTSVQVFSRSTFVSLKIKESSQFIFQLAGKLFLPS